MEIHRGNFCCSLPLSGPRTLVRVDELAYERRDGPSLRLAPPTVDDRHSSLKDAVRQALDWETVTPLHELTGATLSDRLKKGLRWWKLQRTGTG